jgi:hypothetical protein
MLKAKRFNVTLILTDSGARRAAKGQNNGNFEVSNAFKKW